jgi:hypothetical protein
VSVYPNPKLANKVFSIINIYLDEIALSKKL